LIYDYACKSCGSETERVNKIDDRHTNAPVCCGEHMPIVIKKAPMGYVDRPIYYRCPVTNEGVTSKSQRREIMAREGLVSAHELMQTKDQRNAAEQNVKDLSEQSRGPESVRKDVDTWARRELGI